MESSGAGSRVLTFWLCLEKLEDAKARAAIKAQIEADKRARAEKAAREKALRDGASIPMESSAGPGASSTPVQPPPTVSGKDFKETRLQIRLASGGQPYVSTFSSDASEFATNFAHYTI